VPGKRNRSALRIYGGAKIFLIAHDQRIRIQPNDGGKSHLQRMLNQYDFVPMRRARKLHVPPHRPIGDVMPGAIGGMAACGEFKHQRAIAGRLLDEDDVGHVRRAARGRRHGDAVRQARADGYQRCDSRYRVSVRTVEAVN
jgi:hypothetical protein